MVDNQIGKKIPSFHDQTQRAAIEVVYSTGRLVMKEELQRSVLGPLLFNIFINDPEEVMEYLPARFAGDSKLGGTIDTLKSRTDVQSSLDTEGMVQW